MDLKDFRERIDKIDTELIRLFLQRINISAEIARYKKLNNIPVYDPEREQKKLHDLCREAGENRADFIKAIYSLIFEQSRAEQERIMKSEPVRSA